MTVAKRSLPETDGNEAEPAEPESVGVEARSYHHGNLRQALIDAALELVAERGPQGFTLREVARRAGVSHAAPYRHFVDRAALLAATAERAYLALGNELRDAVDRASSPADGLRALAVGYFRFALAHPARFRLLFEPEVRAPEHDGVARASSEVLGLVTSAVVRAQQSGQVRTGEAAELALVVMALMHGLARLIVDGAVRGPADDEVNALAERVYASLRDGLEVRARPS